MNNNLNKYLKYRNKYKYLKQLIGGTAKQLLVFGEEITDVNFNITDYIGTYYEYSMNSDISDESISIMKDDLSQKYNMIICNNCNYNFITKHLENIISLLVPEKGSILYFTNLTQSNKDTLIRSFNKHNFIEFTPLQKSNTVILIDSIPDDTIQRYNTINNVLRAKLYMGLSPDVFIYFFIDVANDSGKIYISNYNQHGTFNEKFLDYTTKSYYEYQTISNIINQITITVNGRQFNVVLDKSKVIHIFPNNQ